MVHMPKNAAKMCKCTVIQNQMQAGNSEKACGRRPCDPLIAPYFKKPAKKHVLCSFGAESVVYKDGARTLSLYDPIRHHGTSGTDRALCRTLFPIGTPLMESIEKRRLRHVHGIFVWLSYGSQGDGPAGTGKEASFQGRGIPAGLL